MFVFRSEQDQPLAKGNVGLRAGNPFSPSLILAAMVLSFTAAECSRIAIINLLVAIFLHQIADICLVTDYLIPCRLVIRGHFAIRSSAMQNF